MFNGSNCDRKSQLSGILTEPLNQRVLVSSFSLFTQILCRFSSIIIEKTTFEEFVEICE